MKLVGTNGIDLFLHEDELVIKAKDVEKFVKLNQLKNKNIKNYNIAVNHECNCKCKCFEKIAEQLEKALTNM